MVLETYMCILMLYRPMPSTLLALTDPAPEADR